MQDHPCWQVGVLQIQVLELFVFSDYFAEKVCHKRVEVLICHLLPQLQKMLCLNLTRLDLQHELLFHVGLDLFRRCC